MKLNPLQYQTYHSTLSDTLTEVTMYMLNRNLSPIDDDGNAMAYIPCDHVAYETTRNLNVRCTTPANNRLGYRTVWVHAAIYRMPSGSYELVIYISAPSR
jgi:hypothetical protein